jgi:hypothetical protein
VKEDIAKAMSALINMMGRGNDSSWINERMNELKLTGAIKDQQEGNSTHQKLSFRVVFGLSRSSFHLDGLTANFVVYASQSQQTKIRCLGQRLCIAPELGAPWIRLRYLA